MGASDYASIPHKLAQRIQREPWAQALGIRYLELRRGYCRLSLSLQPHMVNFQGYPHGGVIFSLADVAFGAACNSHGKPNVALNVTISFLAAVEPGVTLFAEGRERKQGRRAGFYDVSITTEEGTLVALVHCVSHRVGAQ